MTREQLKTLVGDLHGDAFRWATHCLAGQEEEAKEVLQQVYLKILEGKAKYSGASSVKTWLFSIIRYTAIDWMKSRGVFVSWSSAAEKIEETTEPVEMDRNYKLLLQQLPAQQQQVLILHFYHSMTLKEVAVTMEISLGAVGQHFARGKKKLKALILEQENMSHNNLKNYEGR